MEEAFKGFKKAKKVKKWFETKEAMQINLPFWLKIVEKSLFKAFAKAFVKRF